MSSMLENY